MKREMNKDDALILAIGRWSQTPWDNHPPLLAGILNAARIAPSPARRVYPLTANRADGLREMIERSLERPSIPDIAPRLVGLDLPIYLSPALAAPGVAAA